MTHTQESRREAHERIKPMVEGQHCRIIHQLRKFGASTSEELRDVYGTVNSTRARLSELRDKGVIISIGRRRSEKTGIKITVWALGGSMTPPPKKITWRDRAFKAMKELRLVKLELEAAELRLKKAHFIDVEGY